MLIPASLSLYVLFVDVLLGHGFRLGLDTVVRYKQQMSRSHRQRRRRRVRFRSSRKFRLYLLALGVAGLAVGIGLVGAYLINHKTTMALLGGAYIFGSLSLLFGHQAIKATQSETGRGRRGGQAEAHK